MITARRNTARAAAAAARCVYSILLRRTQLLCFSAILSAALAFLSHECSVVGSHFLQCFAVISSSSKNFVKRSAGGGASHPHILRVDDVDKLGEERSDRLPVVGNECFRILAPVGDVTNLVSLDQFDRRFMVPNSYVEAAWFPFVDRISSGSPCKA